jgi:hypothetical protein
MRLTVLPRDGVQDAAHDLVGVLRNRLAGQPLHPRVAGEAQHLLADDLVIAPRPSLELGERKVAGQRVPELCLEQLRAEAAVALSARRNLVAEAAPELVQCGAGGCELCGKRRRYRGVTLTLGLGQPLLDEIADPVQLGERRLHVEQRHRPAIRPRQGVGRVGEEARQPLDTAEKSRAAMRPRRVLTGEDVEQAAARQVDVAERIPGLGAQLRELELCAVERLERDAAVDLLRGREVGVRERVQRVPVAANYLEPRPAAVLGYVRPAVVESVEADGRGPRRLGLEHVIQQGVQGVVERSARLGSGVGNDHRRILAAL